MKVWTPPARSTLHLSPPLIVCGVDPGTTNTGICYREGNRVVWASVVGHEFHAPTSVAEVDLWAAYAKRICDRTVQGYKALGLEGQPIGMVCESYREPSGELKGVKAHYAKLAYLACNMICAGIKCRWGSARIIDPQKFSDAHTLKKGGNGNPYAYYPPEIIGRRGKPWPATWGPNEDDRNRMREVQAAYAIGGKGYEDESDIIPMRLERTEDGEVYVIDARQEAVA